jgi:hypothetical protein
VQFDKHGQSPLLVGYRLNGYTDFESLHVLEFNCLEVMAMGIPISREEVLRQLELLSPESLAEVAQFIEFLRFRDRQPVAQNVVERNAAFGIWADYSEANEPATFAMKLRQKLEARQDDLSNAAG